MGVVTINSKITLSLPQFPSDQLEPAVYNEIQALYFTFTNLLYGISKYTGIDAPTDDSWSQLVPSDTLLEGNVTRMYPIASVAIARGQAVNLFNSAGNLRARLAKADSATTMMHGVANTAAAAGEQFEMYWMRACLDSIGGLALGSLYYLSPAVAGAVQNVRPAAAGNIIQTAGFALAATTLLMDCSSEYIQL